MIVQENISDKLVKTYSDQSFYILHDETGVKYISAVDPISMNRTYTETDIPIPEPVSNIPDTEALRIITGGN